ncbi:TerC family protein [Pelagibacterium sp. 26DY04]|uniref:TerC family protein n=1 Tax=Pelagibacterium sp. 26DY04 TaxID=2967130 RepID=UPI00281672E6|nr:TerC family protein [Pelagibacterium sp. 26DY04]WMT87072.1 TerC family protein [Pelagibacterium sp. 26DY04]
MIDFLFEPAFWASLALLIGMEVALGADNVVFISTIAAKLPPEHRQRTLRIGLVMAAIFRLLLLAGIVWVLGLQRTAFTIGAWAPSWRELILLGGGLFLVYKAVSELHLLVEHPAQRPEATGTAISDSPTLAVIQIVLINAVFSVDSIITAIGLTSYVQAMAAAVVISIAILYFAAEVVGRLIERHPSIKALALGFLLLVGAVLVADGLGFEVVRPYLYGAMGFGVAVLLVVKLVHRRTWESPAVAAPAAATVADRAEPTLEPVVPEPQHRDEPPLEPAASAEPPQIEPEPVELPEEVQPSEAVEPEPGEPEVPEPAEPQAVAEIEPVQEAEDGEMPDDEEGVGEERATVQKSRRKRPILRRRPPRLRTARRRE